MGALGSMFVSMVVVVVVVVVVYDLGFSNKGLMISTVGLGSDAVAFAVSAGFEASVGFGLSKWPIRRFS